MVVFNKVTNLGCDLCAIPSHNQHLPNSPEETRSVYEQLTEVSEDNNVPVQVLEQWVQISIQLGHVELAGFLWPRYGDMFLD
jgi:hypothetical protein